MGSHGTQSDQALVMSARIEEKIARLALRQNGNVTGEQLRDLGVGREQQKSWARRKRLFAVHQGVFAVGRPPQTAIERYAAAGPRVRTGRGAEPLLSPQRVGSQRPMATAAARHGPDPP
jgi:hypothetical protein